MAVNSLDVPERYREGLILLARLRPNLVERLYATVYELQPTLYPWSLIEQIMARIQDIDRGVLEPLLTALLSLFPASEELDIPLPQVATEISNSSDLDLNDAERLELAGRIVRLTEPRAMMVTSKALNLLTEFERSYHDARIVSDVRPIFSREPKQGMAAAIIVHTLVITFHGDQPLQKVHIAMDGDDIKNLQAVLDRAVAKAASLQGFLTDAKVQLLNPLESNDSHN
ncbi:MAG: hypothetical protein M3077_08350 [Candidatus Dormibacteraeota bacterium]|nr:hypothetical protein [Candidatus Dormibacteraeota bacterium]